MWLTESLSQLHAISQKLKFNLNKWIYVLHILFLGDITEIQFVTRVNLKPIALLWKKLK